MMFIILLLLSLCNNSNSFTCRQNCAICDPINNGTCLQCINNQWGDMCQNKCQCTDDCDVNSGHCIISVSFPKKNDITIIYLFVYIVMCIAFITLLIRASKYASKH